jgi:Holliday junction DNA helicase RuvA
MIARLRGRIWEKDIHRVVVDVNGAGYELTISTSTAARLGEPGDPCELFVSTQLREDSLTLFGFGDAEERSVFQLLIGVSGIGPKLAIAVLSTLSPGELAAAIKANDLARLTRISGVGKKTAERMVIELRDKIQTLALAPAAVAETHAAPPSSEKARAVQALVQMGVAQKEAERLVEQMPPEMGDASAMVRWALQNMGTR